LTTEGVKVEHKFGQVASASAFHETKVVSTGDKTDSMNTESIALAVVPLKGVQVSGSHTVIDSETNGGQTATDVGVAVKPNKQFALKARYFEKDSDTGLIESRKDVQIESRPAEFIKIIGAYGQKETSSALDTSAEARLEIQPLKGATITGGYKQLETLTFVSRTKDVSGTVKASSYLELSGSYKGREMSGASTVDSKAVKVALNPVRRWKLFGSYEANPEDQSGVVQQFESKGLGIQTRLGSVTLAGRYSLRDDYLTGKLAYERQIDMITPLFGYGRLTTGFKETETRLQSQQASITYSLGYQHDIGSSFTFALQGYLTQYQLNQALLEDQTDYKAEMKLGVKF